MGSPAKWYRSRSGKYRSSDPRLKGWWIEKSDWPIPFFPWKAYAEERGQVMACAKTLAECKVQAEQEANKRAEGLAAGAYQCKHCGRLIVKPYPGADYWRHLSGPPPTGGYALIHCVTASDAGEKSIGSMAEPQEITQEEQEEEEG